MKGYRGPTRSPEVRERNSGPPSERRDSQNEQDAPEQIKLSRDETVPPLHFATIHSAIALDGFGSAQRGTPYSLGSMDAVSEVGFSPGCFSRSNSSSLMSV